ncbi:MAG: ATP-binding protein [Clostridiales Family XIII bacterium]|jgi:predicted AAA+ superfamily ATPase|nr:ATP-binding protein [Clostridiales Family XIII bacterium]
MPEKLIKRNIEDSLLETLSDTPIAVVQGARQVGKSTLTSMIADKLDCRQLTFDNPDILLAAMNDPVNFVNQYPDGLLILDEVQLYPDILRIIKLSVDQRRQPGRFLLTGSADLLHISKANESLAGRAETIKLFPFSRGEMNGTKEDFITDILSGHVIGRLSEFTPLTRKDYAELIDYGGFPAILDRNARRRDAYFRNYLPRVLDHDAIVISNLSHTDKLSKLFSIISAETSGIFIQANIARKVGIPESSIGGYIKLLQDLHLIHMLSAWGRNLAKRAVSRPKISVLDTGVACNVNGTHHEFLADISGGSAFGPLLETFVTNELLKQQTWSDAGHSLFHYRDRENREVDIIAELPDGRIIALEVKAAASISRRDFIGINYIRGLLGERFCCGIVLYTGVEAQQFGDRMFFAPISTIWR